jgi:hypothetical protein
VIARIKSSTFRVARLFCSILLCVSFAAAASGSDKDSESKSGATATVHINASQSVVWNTITDVKQFDNTIDAETADGAIVEQRFTRLPLLGEMVVVFKVTTTPQQRVEFNMIRSNCLKAFSGNWLVTPISNDETEVEMHSLVEPMLPIPQFLVNQFVSNKMHKRLLKLKKLSELHPNS